MLESMAARLRRYSGRVSALLVGLLAVASVHAGEPLTIYAASSLTESLGSLAAAWKSARPAEQAPRLVFASSAILARQIEAGAAADVFFAADTEWMDYLAERRLIRRETRRELLSNRLVLIAPAAASTALQIAPRFPLAAALGEGRLALGDPDYVPAGRYARSALMSLGVWSDVADRLVRAENVRVALAYVARGEAPLGIVYATDARTDPRVRVLDTFPADSHPAIRYPVALTAIAAPRAGEFVEFAASAAGARIFVAAGFAVLAPAGEAGQP